MGRRVQVYDGDHRTGAVVRFTNHPKGAPVVWLAQGDVLIDGTVSLDGEDGSHYSAPATFAQPGPGGFSGGRRGYTTNLQSSAGFGPGGAGFGDPDDGGGGVYDGTYGNAQILPLIGGSGGSPRADYYYHIGGGGAAGGAILIASSGAITLGTGGLIGARGGDGGYSDGGGGSGGSIRLIADGLISGNGDLRAQGGSGSTSGGDGGAGRIRVEAIDIELTDGGSPAWTSSAPGSVFPPIDAPTLRIVSVDSNGAPADPAARILTTDVEINNADAVTVSIAATNIPLDTIITVFVIPVRGNRTEAYSGPLDGTFESSTATASVTFPPGRVEIQLKANWTP